MSRRPDLVEYGSEQDYQRHFEDVYCRDPIETFDAISVRFQKSQFSHAFFESIGAPDNTFSKARAKRIDWIKWALQNPGAELYFGWEKKRKRVVTNRRVAIVNGDFVVVIRLIKSDRAVFVTAYVADRGTIGKIRLNGQWIKKYR